MFAGVLHLSSIPSDAVIQLFSMNHPILFIIFGAAMVYAILMFYAQLWYAVRARGIIKKYGVDIIDF